jgi:AraC family transcriptional regulator
MADEPFTLSFGVTYDMVAAQTACGQLLTLTSHRCDDRIPPHRHANNYVCIVLKGGFAEMQEKTWVERRNGSFFGYSAGETHHDRFGPEGAMCLNLHFSVGDPRADGLEGRCSTPIKVASSRLAFELVTRSDEELVMAALAAEIVGEIGLAQGPAGDSAGWLPRIVEAISDEPGRRWTLRELADIAGRHPVHVAQAFRARTGISLGHFQRVRRLVRLSMALRDQRSPLADVASEFGYFDQSHMNSEFRRAFGTSPGRYRREFH